MQGTESHSEVMYEES